MSFLLKLIEAGVEVLFADLPELNGAMGKFVLITMANVAELESLAHLWLRLADELESLEAVLRGLKKPELKAS